MAKEIQSINVDPSEESDTINVWQTFGWEFKSTQEIKTLSSSHLERRGDDIYNVTVSGDHYVKLTFERDPARKNYNELVSLESQYNDVPAPGRMPRLGRIIIGIGIVLFIMGLLAIAGGGGKDGSAFIFLVPGIGIIILRVAFYFTRKGKWEANYNNWRNKQSKILEKAKPLS